MYIHVHVLFINGSAVYTCAGSAAVNLSQLEMAGLGSLTSSTGMTGLVTPSFPGAGLTTPGSPGGKTGLPGSATGLTGFSQIPGQHVREICTFIHVENV